MEVSEFLFQAPVFKLPTASPEAVRIAHKLNAHVNRFLDGTPWMPFHHTLGISGYELSFDHPDELFYSLSIALPCLPETTGRRLTTYLRGELSASPPYAAEGFDYRTGRPRESYDVPESLRVRGRGKASSVFGVYAFWAYCHYTGDSNALAHHWPAVQARVKPLLERSYAFDPARTNLNKGEAQKLNGDLAGLIGFMRLANELGDKPGVEEARRRVRELLELRVNLERINPCLVEKSNLATKDLHNGRLSRYCDLVPEVGSALGRLSADCGARNLRAFREERSGWYLAFGDRLIGGENYTNPLHFPRSVFTGAALIEQLPAEQLFEFIDVPWGEGDFYFIEKCVFALWANAGRPWTNL